MNELSSRPQAPGTELKNILTMCLDTSNSNHCQYLELMPHCPHVDMVFPTASISLNHAATELYRSAWNIPSIQMCGIEEAIASIGRLLAGELVL